MTKRKKPRSFRRDYEAGFGSPEPSPSLTQEWVARLEIMASDVGEEPEQYLERLVRRAWAGRGGDVSRAR